MQNKLIERVAKRFECVTGWRHFDMITGTVSLLNPIAIAPQLWGVITAENVEAISIGMWIVFVLLQSTFALVAVKGRNLGMFISMLVSVVISASIIVIVALKT